MLSVNPTADCPRTSDRFPRSPAAYINQIGDRVTSFGGDSYHGFAFGPSVAGPGNARSRKPEPPEKMCEDLMARSDCMIYDHFGEFEGYEFLSRRMGEHHRFSSRENRIFKIVREALGERGLFCVRFEEHHPHAIRSIIVKAKKATSDSKRLCARCDDLFISYFIYI